MKLNPVFLRIRKDDPLDMNEKSHFLLSLTVSFIVLYFTVGVFLSAYNLTFAGIFRILQ